MQHRLERVVDLDTGAQRIRVVLETDGSNHELLNINVGVCVRATVEDVHHGNGKHVGVGATQILVEGKVCGLCGSLSNGQRNAQNCVSAQLTLVIGGVQSNHGLIDGALIGGVDTDNFFRNLFNNRLDSPQNTLAQVYGLVAIAALNRFPLTGGCTRRHSSACESAVFEQNLNLNGRVAAGI